MGMFQNFIPRAELPVARESSHLLSPRESGQRGRMWQYVRDNTIRAGKLTNSVGVTQRAIERMGRRNQGFSHFHPFKIYIPSTYWPNSQSAYVLSSASLYRTFRVRNGLVLTTTVLGLNIEGTGQPGVKGADQVDLPYDEAFLYRKNGVTQINSVPEYVVPNNTAIFVFWVEVYNVSGVDYAVLRYGADPDDPLDTDYHDGVNPDWTSDNPWTTYPAPDSTHFAIGTVDTNTIKGQAIIRQYQTTDIMAGGGSGGQVCPFGAIIGFLTLSAAVFMQGIASMVL